ncbi:MAG: hypothetical protein LBB18_04055, partial [Puniceicoccales bacterium]|nr:hypothetical protein [Puniceicoccales bacterium]
MHTQPNLGELCAGHRRTLKIPGWRSLPPFPCAVGNAIPCVEMHTQPGLGKLCVGHRRTLEIPGWRSLPPFHCAVGNAIPCIEMHTRRVSASYAPDTGGRWKS